MIKEYYLQDGSKRYLFKSYLGIDPITGKQKHTTRRGFKTKKEAMLSLSRLKLEVDEHGIKQYQKMTFEEIYKLWRDQYKNTVKESTYVIQLDVIRLHILPHFGNLLIDKITLQYCQKQVNNWYSYYAKYSNLIGLTQRILDFAISLELISDNPMKKAVRPKRKKKIDGKEHLPAYYSKNELQQFFECIKQEDLKILLLFRLLAFTGVRKSELLALRWKDIILSNETLSVNQTLARGINYKPIFQTPKTSKSIRTISLDSVTLSLLKKWRLNQKEILLVQGIPSVESHGLIFTDIDGQAHDMDYPNRLLREFISKYSLKKITVHGFRHTHCSLLFEAGASIKEVQERLGHTDIQTTMNIYTHVTDQAKEITAQKFAAYVNF